MYQRKYAFGLLTWEQSHRLFGYLMVAYTLLAAAIVAGIRVS